MAERPPMYVLNRAPVGRKRSHKKAIIAIVVLLFFLFLGYAFYTGSISFPSFNSGPQIINVDIPETSYLGNSCGTGCYVGGTPIHRYNLTVGDTIVFHNTQQPNMINGIDSNAEGVCFGTIPQGVIGFPPCSSVLAIGILGSEIVNGGGSYSVTFQTPGTYQVFFVPSSWNGQASGLIFGGNIVVSKGA